MLSITVGSSLAAGNGFLPIGSGRNLDLGGAGAALPLDASSTNTNPALAARVSNSFYILAGPEIYKRSVDTRQATASNYTYKQRNRMTAAPAANIGYNYHFCQDWTFNVATDRAYTGAHFENSLYDQTVSGRDDRQDYYLVSAAPGIAWSPNSCQAYGVSVVFAESFFRSNGLTAASTPTTGNDRWDSAFGAGFKVGGLWDVSPCVTLGLAYTSPIWFENFGKYRDLFNHAVNTPPIVDVGVVWHFNCNTLLSFDVKGIFWKDQKATGESVRRGGLNWKNQTIFALGLQHTQDCWTGRIGINYGKSPHTQKDLYRSVLMPAEGKATLCGGLTYHYRPDLELDIHFQHRFNDKLTENGKGSGGAAVRGTKLEGSSSYVAIGINWLFCR